MVHRYYHCLRPWQQRVYRQSNEVTTVPLRARAGLRAPLLAVDQALAAGDARLLGRAATGLVARLCRQLRVAAPAVTVLAERPAGHWGELHGLYHPDQGALGTITVWMRTAAGRIVAFRTFLRTLLHELCHHLDLALLGLACSFHTTGFGKRESHLFVQLLGVGEGAMAVAAPAGGEESPRRKTRGLDFRREDSSPPAGASLP